MCVYPTRIAQRIGLSFSFGAKSAVTSATASTEIIAREPSQDTDSLAFTELYVTERIASKNKEKLR